MIDLGWMRRVPRARATLGAFAVVAVLGLPAVARASSVTDAGEGFPLSVNASDHILIAKLVIEEEEGKSEENIAGPWSIWAGGSSTPLAPLNGGPETKEVALGEPEHSLFLYRLNAAGAAGGTSTITYFKEGKEHTVHRAAYYTPDGVGHEVPPLHETITNEKGEPVVVGAIGTGIDGAGDVAGLGVVKVGEHARSRGFFSAGGTASPSVVGESDGPWTEIFSMNEAGTMFGTVSEMKITETEEGKTEEEPVHPKYVLWKTPGGSATILNFDAPLAGFPLADDGSVLGYVAGKLMLREPSGTETEVTGLSKPFAVNSSHIVVGSEMVEGAEHAAVWQSGTVTDLNAQLPEKSGWVLQRAVAINDNGDIAGIGTHGGKTRVFLLKGAGIVVTNAGDEKRKSKATSGICVTEKSGCTLRAAIETVNEAAKSTVTPVTFDVKGGKPAEIAPASALPAVTAPINIEGASQPGAFEEGGAEEGRKVGAIIDGTKAGPDGLVLESPGSIVSGLVLKSFAGGDGVLLKGEHDVLADSVLYKDKVGVEVAGSNDVIGPGEELPGNDFVEDGDTPGLASYIGGLKPGTAPKAYDEALAGFGAAVLLGKGPTSGTQITGNLIGLAGGLKSALSLTTGVSTFGVLLDPSSGTVDNVTIGGAGTAKNLIAGDFTGVELLGSAGGTAANISVLGNQIGGNRGAGGESELGAIVGLMAEGKISGLQVGTPAAGNTFPADIIGALLAGGELSAPSIQGNTFGVDKGIEDFSGGMLGKHDILGIVAADTTGALIGGPGAGNKVLGAPLGIVLAGKESSGNQVESNTIGRNAPPPGPFDLSEKSFDTGQFGGVLGLLDASGSKQQIGSAGAGNTIQGNLIGILSTEEKDDAIQGNAIVKNGFGLLDFDSGGTLLGGAGAGQGNQILSSAIGAFFSNVEPTKQELEDARASEKAISSGVRKGTLKDTPKESEALADVNATTTADLTEALFEPPSKPGTNIRIEGNLIGTNPAGDTTNGGGETLGSAISLLIAGDEHEVKVGGVAAGQGNHIVNGGSGGLLIAGEGKHAPTVQALGNTIYNNSTFGGGAVGIPGLGISLIRVQGSGEVDPVFGFTVNPQDPKQPDEGPNFLQNSPILSSATSSGGTLSVAGTLQGVPDTSYTIELFADQFKNPYGAGEGQQSIGRFNLATDASGHASFTATAPAPSATAQYVSATATTLPAGGAAGVTSEFALDSKIAVVPPGAEPPATSTTTTTTGTTTTGTTPGVAATGIVVHSGAITAIVSGVKATLPGVTVSCASSSTGCTATATASEPTAGGARVAGATRKRAPAVLARWSAHIAPGHSSRVTLTLTRRAHTLLLRKHSLRMVVLVSVKAGVAGASTRRLSLHLVPAKPKKKTKAKR